jgi:hypothetical protein
VRDRIAWIRKGSSGTGFVDFDMVRMVRKKVGDFSPEAKRK